MNPILRNFLAVLAGGLVGMIVNGGLISISGSIIPLPEGVDPNNMDSIMAAMPDFESKHFIMPFLAHALGTLAGAFVAVKLAVSHHLKFALGIGALFLIGGIMMVMSLPSPLWFPQHR